MSSIFISPCIFCYNQSDMKKFEPAKIEAKWQDVWAQMQLYKTNEMPKKPFYNLVMFPYPSGDLHIGHWSNFAPADSLARFIRMQGYDLLSPIGFDSFGLPAENAAIKRGLTADNWTDDNIAQMTKQLKSMGAMYDWSKTVNTSKPDYYKWTQWLFLQFFKAGSAYQAEGLVNWCASCQTVLANEQVINGKCERCDSPVERQNLKQWYLKITDYTDRLLDNLDKLNWPEKIKIMQRNWIGRSKGAQIHFAIDGREERIEVFTTRPDTIFGATFIVLAPEHPLVELIVTDQQRTAVHEYVTMAGTKTDVQRQEEVEKTGVFTGRYGVNPLNGEQVPIWIADYVLMGYGTGAIMAVPAHDERDYEFAKKYGLEITQVISGGDITSGAHEGGGKLIHSGEFDGMSVDEAKVAIAKKLKSDKKGGPQIQYRLRDWLISRQRYWGTPIPIIHCDKCGPVAVPEKDLPVTLPLKQKFDSSGRSPLLDHPDFSSVKCPNCDCMARRETDTMDTFVDSSWYFLRYPNPNYDKGPFDPGAVKTWLPVDSYIGGAEHAVMHLLYARYFTMFLYDRKMVDFEEPFIKLINQGIILGPDGAKMSKSKGNVIDPGDYVKKYGADAVRLYLMFMGPYEDEKPWDGSRFEGTYRFIKRVWELISTDYQVGRADATKETELTGLLHKALKKVGEDIALVKFNTAIAALMELVNTLGPVVRAGQINKQLWQEFRLTITLMLAPLTPHLAEELWREILIQPASVHLQGWPQYDPELIHDTLVTIVIQVDGKRRGEFLIEAGADKKAIEKQARAKNQQEKYTGDKQLLKTIVVPGRLVNFVTKQ